MDKDLLTHLESELFETVEINTWEDFRLKVLGLARHFIFRGQGNSDWVLQSTIERANFLSPSDAEISMRGEFNRKRHLFDHNFGTPREPIGDFSLMRHFGAPVRLLDFSYSPYIASFFAFESSSERYAVYAIDWGILTAQSYSILRELSDHEKYPELKSVFTETGGMSLNSPMLHEVVLNSKSKIDIVLFQNSLFPNHRLDAQQGCFLTYGNIRKSFLENSREVLSRMKGKAYKFILSENVRKVGLKELNLMGISNQSLFLGFEGFVKSLKDIARLDELNY